MPVAVAGALPFARYQLPLPSSRDVDGHVHAPSHVAAAIRGGQAVVVLHGIDHNGDGKYGESAAGAGKLDPTGVTRRGHRPGGVRDADSLGSARR